LRIRHADELEERAREASRHVEPMRDGEKALPKAPL
jgi:hypothetical protein